MPPLMFGSVRTVRGARLSRQDDSEDQQSRRAPRISPVWVDGVAEVFVVDAADAAVDAGINDFDTADVCGGPQAADMTKGYRVSEEVIGRWLRRSGRRDEIVPATTVYQPRGLGPSDRRLSAYHLRRACDIPMEQHRRSHRLPPLSSERRGHVGGPGKHLPNTQPESTPTPGSDPVLRLPPSWGASLRCCTPPTRTRGTGEPTHRSCLSCGCSSWTCRLDCGRWSTVDRMASVCRLSRRAVIGND
jgi:hypothetical protein